MKKELYQKVYIKDQSDLPKENGEYWCHFKIGVKAMTLVKRVNVNSNEFDYYLQPIKSPLPEITDTDLSIIEGHLITIKEFMKELFVSCNYSESRLKDRIDANQEKLDFVRKMRSQLQY